MYLNYLNFKKNSQLLFSYQKCPFSAVRKGLRLVLVILTNFTYFGHDGSYYFNDYRRTRNHSLIKQNNSARKIGLSGES